MKDKNKNKAEDKITAEAKAKTASMSGSKNKRFVNFLRISALIFLLIALSMIAALRIFANEKFILWYTSYADGLKSFQTWVESWGQTPIAVLLILLNFFFKALVPWFPITVIMFLAGMIFDWYIAIPINAVGVAMLFTIKYYWGKKIGGGNAEKILSHYDKAHFFLEEGKLGSKMVLFFTRLTPLVPINSVSRLYGTTTLPFWRYLLVSMLGFSYKLVSYTIIARNIFNPLSSSFFVPIITLLILTGLVLIALYLIITATSPFVNKIIDRYHEKHKNKK